MSSQQNHPNQQNSADFRSDSKDSQGLMQLNPLSAEKPNSNIAAVAIEEEEDSSFHSEEFSEDVEPKLEELQHPEMEGGRDFAGNKGRFDLNAES